MSKVKYCPHCQKEVLREKTVCEDCGYEFVPEKNEEPANVVKNVDRYDPVPAFIWSAIGFVLPPVGFILYLVFRKTWVARADNLKDSATLGLIVWAIGLLFYFFFGINWNEILKNK